MKSPYDVNFATPEDPAIPDELLALIYIFLLDEENLEALITSQSALPSRSKLASDLVGKLLALTLGQRESEYATTVEEDEKLLKAGRMRPRAAMAVQVRLGEKKVLRQAIEEALTFEGTNKRMRTLRQSPLSTARNGGSQSFKGRAEYTSKSAKRETP